MTYLGARERLLYLRSLPLFGSLPADELAMLGEYMDERAFAKGELLAEEGKPIQHVDLIVEGEVSMTRGGRAVRTFRARDPVGLLGLLADDQQGIGARALTDGLSLRLDAEGLLDLFEDNYSVLHHVLVMANTVLLEQRKRIPDSGGFNPPDEVPDSDPPAPLDLVQRMALLQKTMPFAGGNVSSLAQLARRVREERFEDGQVLWKEGDAGDTMILITHGMVEGTTRAGQRFTFDAGGGCGVLDSMAHQPRWFQATARGRTVGLVLSGEDFYDILEDCPDLGMELLRACARQVVVFVEQGFDMESLPGIARIDPHTGSWSLRP